MHWQAYPFFRLLLFLLPGIVFLHGPGVRLGGAVLLLFIVVFLAWHSVRYRWRYGFGISLAILLPVMISWRGKDLTTDTRFSTDLGNNLTQPVLLGGQVISWNPGRRWTQVTLSVEALRRDSLSWQEAKGRVLLYLPAADSTGSNLGCTFVGRVLLRRIPAAANPGGFDGRRYWGQQGIYLQGFLGEGDWWMDVPEKTTWQTRLVNCRSWVERRLLGAQGKAPEWGIAAALVLGDKSHLTPEVRSAFTHAGAMHVLAVSGLHVGMVAFGVRWLLGLLTWLAPFGHRWGRFAWNTAAIWGFAILTGAGPAVLRAALLFTILLWGRTLDRRGSSWNALWASAFILLWFRPLLFFQVGFQLSYAAVVGILFFQPRLEACWRPAFRPVRYFWQLTTVGLAAQWMTFPLCVYYFHQFSWLGLLSGWVVIPAAALILAMGFLQILLAGIPLAGEWLTWGFGGILHFFWKIMAFFGQLPGALWQGIWWTEPQFWLGLLLAFWGIIAVKYRHWTLLAAGGFLIGLLAGMNHRTIEQQKEQQQVIVYNHRGGTLVDFICGNQRLTWSSVTDPRQESAIALAARQRFGVEHPTQTIQLTTDVMPVLQWQKHSWLWLDGQRPLPVTPPQADIWVVSSSLWAPWETWLDLYPPQLIILDATNRYSTRSYLRKLAASRAIPLIDIAEQGSAFQCDLRTFDPLNLPTDEEAFD